MPGLQLAPRGCEGHLTSRLLWWEKRGLFPPACVVRFRDRRALFEMLCTRLQEGEWQQKGKDASTWPLLSTRAQGEKTKMASSAQSRQDWERKVLAGKGTHF